MAWRHPEAHVLRRDRRTPTFRIRGLPAEPFAHLFALPDAELAAHGALRKIADGPGEQTYDAVGSVPVQLRRRTLAVRGFDDKGMMTGWQLIEGVFLEEAIEKQFADPHAHYLHIHFAAPGCYAAKVERA